MAFLKVLRLAFVLNHLYSYIFTLFQLSMLLLRDEIAGWSPFNFPIVHVYDCNKECLSSKVMFSKKKQ